MRGTLLGATRKRRRRGHLGGFARGSRQGGLRQHQQWLRRHLERMLSDRPKVGAKDRRAPATLRPQCALLWGGSWPQADRSLAPGRLAICDRIRYFLSMAQ
jgi:hypothetical protein